MQERKKDGGVRGEDEGERVNMKESERWKVKKKRREKIIKRRRCKKRQNTQGENGESYRKIARKMWDKCV